MKSDDSHRRSKRKHAADFRIICDCQHEAKRKASRWRRVLTAASRGVAVLLGVPLAFGALGIPSDATSLNFLSDAKIARAVSVMEDRSLPIFTSKKTREEFFASAPVARVFNLEVAKEEFFRTQIPYGTIIYREAQRHGLDPALVAAVVATESDFRPRLVSNKSAQGLMQIIPSTASLLGVSDPFDPEENIAAGTKYLRYLFDRFDDQNLALAAYNAGEGNVSRHGGVPPFPETQNYLRRVSARTHHYRERVRRSYVAGMRIRTDVH
ncbi:MAG TPA: lytic transglycosylase domain-containing protein [Thermoanaerobaculia bacterium]